jgi:hypothetical protein
MALEVVQTSGELERYVGKIKDKINNISSDFFYIGYYLWEVNHFKHYLEHGYKNVYEFAENELNFKKSSTSNFILLVEKYADYSQGPYPKMWMAEKYKAFGYSHLVEMLSLSADRREEIKPDMTIKEIREIKKEVKKIVPDVFETDFVEVKQADPVASKVLNVKLPCDSIDYKLDIPYKDQLRQAEIKTISDLTESRDYLIRINEKLEQETRRLSLLLVDQKQDELKELNEVLKSKDLEIKKLKSKKVVDAPKVAHINLSLALSALERCWSNEADDDLAKLLRDQIDYIISII